jgi:5-methyltetrahydropteroyltriglutamate--homocysteine methyltransferase
VLAVSFGSYPRIGDTPGEQTLRRALHAFDRDEIAAEELEAVHRDVVKTVLREQAEAGLDVLTDGQVTWNDPLSHVARGLDGVEINGLLRWFDNNFYYRQPVLTGPVRWAKPILLEELEFASAAADRPLKAVLPGPLTFAAMSREGAGPVSRAGALAVAEALNRELGSWAEVELAYVQVEEPSFGSDTDRGFLRELYAALLRDVTLPVIVAPCFRDVSRAWPALFDLPVAGFHLDLRSHAANASALDGRGLPEDAAVSLGVLDARNTRRESPAEVAREVERLRTGLASKGPLLLTTSCGLEFLPRSAARQKLRILAEIRDLVAGTPAAVGAR